jgi:hypothetical protein
MLELQSRDGREVRFNTADIGKKIRFWFCGKKSGRDR